MNQFGNDNDLNLKWCGLTTNLLIDIYSVHKALMFGQFKFTDYTNQQFLDNIQEAEKRVFGEAICSPVIEGHQSAFNVSLHPSYVVNDDISDVMAFHFAVSLLVNRLEHKDVDCKDLVIRSIVVPEAVVSIYDSHIDHQSSIQIVEEHLKSVSPSNTHLYRQILPNIKDIGSMTQSLFQMFKVILQMGPLHSTGDIVFVFNRRKGANTATVFQCDDHNELIDLYQNYFIGFDFKLQWEPHGDNRSAPKQVVRCWMRFGVNQRIRFYPELLLWIVPRLFARSDKVSANEMMKRLYGAEYKWGWRVCVDDPVFDRFYHIITQYEHITNNYNRNEMVSSKMESESGLCDHLENHLHFNLSAKLRHFVDEQAFDSDAILEDSLAEKRANDGKYSNISRFLSASGLGLHFRAFRHSLLRYRGTVSSPENVLPIDECPYVEDLVTDLQRLKECNLNIDATNFWQFELDSIVPSWGHTLSVYKLLSDDEEHKESKQKIQSYILERVQCDEGSKCKALRAHRERRRETDRAHRVEMEPDAVTAECEAVEEALFGIHCQIFHGQNEQKRSAPSEDDQGAESRFNVAVSATAPTSESKQDDESKDDGVSAPVAIDFGRSVLRWLKANDSPHFDTLRNELISNPHSTIDMVIYDRLRKWAIAQSKYNDHTVDESLGLKAYSDTNDFQAALGRAHWESASQDDRRSFYHWAMTLYRVHLRSAVPISPVSASKTKPRPLYTGFNILLSLGHELGAYYGPLSTTKSVNVASNFSKGNGQIYKYGSSYANTLRRTLGIDMESVSCYPQEQEVMLYHSVVPIQSTTTQSNDASELVNHLLFSLKARDTPIVNKDAFYKKLGIKWTSSWIPLILSHKLLFKKTLCNGMTVQTRLIQELQQNVFALAPLVRGALFVDDDCNVKLKNTPTISSKLFAEFVFGFQFKAEKGADIHQYEAASASKFKFSCQSIMDSVSNSLRLDVFCRAKGGSSDFQRIHSVFLNQYDLSKADPLTVAESIAVPPFDPKLRIGGRFWMKSPSDIIIAFTGAITRELVDDSDSMKPDMASRIAIKLVSGSSIINEGVLSCNLVDGEQRGARSVYLVAPSVINHGEIQCDSDIDELHIICDHFENTGIISAGNVWVHITNRAQFNTQILDEVMQSSDPRKVFILPLVANDKGVPIKLTVDSHRGHRDDDNEYHIQNVLRPGTYHFYDSAATYGRHGYSRDWFIFKMETKRRFFPKTVGIRNDNLKRIAIHGKGDDDEQFVRWIEIKDIREGERRDDGYINNNEVLQSFPIDPESGYIAMERGFHTFRVNVLDNHGASNNIFYEFQICGVHLLPRARNRYSSYGRRRRW